MLRRKWFSRYLVLAAEVCWIASLVNSSAPAEAARFAVNTQVREEARAFYNAVFQASTNSDLGWTGSIGNCDPGTISAAAQERIRLRVNYYRAMAGVPAGVTFSSSYNAMCQRAALMFSANNSLSHTPPANWTCYAADGATAASKSDIAFGLSGPSAIDGYMIDRSLGNEAVGHRRWILYPQTTLMGTGDVPESGSFSRANALYVVGDEFGKPRPATRDSFVSWPPPGFVPYQIVPVRWSISFPGANFRSATVLMSSNGVNVPVTREAVADGYGENTLVWRPSALNVVIPYEWPKPAADIVFAIAISNVTGAGAPTAFNYSVKMFDPASAGVGTVVPLISGPDSAPVGVGAQMAVAADPLATGYDLRTTAYQTVTGVENGDAFLSNFTTNSAESYSIIVSNSFASGPRGFRLCHSVLPNQWVAFKSTFLPAAGAQINFSSMLMRSLTTEFAKVQVSTNGGGGWIDVFSQAGNGSSLPQETTFQARSASLAAFVGRPVQVRFAYLSSGGSFNSVAANVGWYFDDISFVNTSSVSSQTTASIPAGAPFTFVPPGPGLYSLEARPRVWNDFALEFGPAKFLTATAAALVISSPVTLAQSTVQFTFDSSVLGSPSLRIYKSPFPGGPWTVDDTAAIEIVVPAAKFRATVPRPTGAAVFYRAGHE